MSLNDIWNEAKRNGRLYTNETFEALAKYIVEHGQHAPLEDNQYLKFQCEGYEYVVWEQGLPELTITNPDGETIVKILVEPEPVVLPQKEVPCI